MELTMSKSFWTLLRGAVHAAEQDAIDQVCHPNITSSPNRGVA